MNIFEHLGLPAGHRSSNKVVQLVKHWREVNPRHEEEGILHKKVSFPLFGQVKKDGVFCIVLYMDGEVTLFNRTGKRMSNTVLLEAWYERAFQEDNVAEAVYFAELCSSSASLEELSGMVNPNRNGGDKGAISHLEQYATLYFFDCIGISEFVEGYTDNHYDLRYYQLTAALGSRYDVLGLHTFHNFDDLQTYANMAIDQGEEGIVIKQNVEWKAGAKDWHQMKIVRRCEYDLECIGWEEGDGKYLGAVANLLFRWKGGKVVKAMLGKGWTLSDAQGVFQRIKRGDSPVGEIFTVYALQESSKGVLRLPKVGQLRHDKTVPDF